MNSRNWTETDLLGYLDSQLPSVEMTQLEDDLRSSDALREQLESLSQKLEDHSIGEIWRRHRLSCPSREELQKRLEGTLSSAQSEYVDFHLNSVGCEICQANYEDLHTKSQLADDVKRRRRQIFESSAGFLGSKETP